MIFISGIAGQLFYDQALTVTFALIASLLVALTLIPMLASRGGPQKYAEHPERLERPAPRNGWRKLFAPFAWLRFILWSVIPHGILWLLRKVGVGLRWLALLIAAPILKVF